MAKVAIASEDLDELRILRELLAERFQLTVVDAPERNSDGQYVAVFTVVDLKLVEVKEMLSLIENATGVVITSDDRSHHAVHARRAVAHLLHHRFDYSHYQIAEMLHYKSHASSVTACKQLGELEVRNCPIELAIRRVLSNDSD